MSLIRNTFKRLHYPVDIIAQCVRWYLAYALNLRNLEEMMAESGIAVDHSTLSRWVHRLVPLMIKRYWRSKPAVGRRWRMDETSIKIKGQWSYLYRALDSGGNTIDFLLTVHRDKKAALRFFKKAMRQHGQLAVVTIDKSGANKVAVDELNKGKPKEEVIVIRQNKYLNNLIEQDHRNVKQRTRPLLGFKNFRRAQTVLAGIEPVCMLRKGQYLQEPEYPTSPAAYFYRLTA
ncbi:IS6 family transposase [Xenorhabdus budapestensis]|uniref:IS6 family transposase n=1 Tax=Xenorhabdus budapestensis TaxID=290110 RepID=A0ABX7VJH5_XENBU|nr:IS6 family transposase [Xenorhabdus budapestensis]QTL39947.1 IS6 family transposase [Xenorhabdus budapestensis]